MKSDIHPKYHKAEIVCGTCGATWDIGSTRQGLRVSICSNCHPFYTGAQRQLVDTEGQVDRFMKKLARTQQRQASEAERTKKQDKKPAKKSLLQEIYGEEATGDSADATASSTETSTPDSTT